MNSSLASRTCLLPLLLATGLGCARERTEPVLLREASGEWDAVARAVAPPAWVGDTLARWVDTELPTPVSARSSVPHDARVIDSRRLTLESSAGSASTRAGLDAVRFRGRTYLGVRSVSSRAGVARASVDIVSSADEVGWRREASLSAGSELSAPRFLAWNGAVFTYVTELASGASRLEPRAVLGSRLDADGTWAEWKPLALEGHVVWRTKVERGVPLMTSYVSRDKTYEFDEARMEVRLLTTEDGFDWRPLASGRSAVYRGGGSEAAFSSDDDGNLYSVVRTEASEVSGFGSALCAAEASDWSRWECVNDPKKYDSPTLFSHEGELYLLARRHLSGDGSLGQGQGLSLLRRLASEARDLAAPKRCSLWHYDRGHKRIDFVLDLPSKGNTCSPAVVPGENAGEFVVYDHSSDVHGPDLSLQEGLAGPTFVYRHLLRLERPRAHPPVPEDPPGVVTPPVSSELTAP